MVELLELQKLETSSDEVSVCAVSWSSCEKKSCNSVDESFTQG